MGRGRVGALTLGSAGWRSRAPSIMPGEISQSLALDTTAPSRARGLVEPLRGLIDAHSFDAVRQVVDELVAQCVQDANREEQVLLEVQRPTPELIELAVTRPTHHPDRTGLPPDPGDAARIAYRLVDRLVEQWGVRETPGHVTVWLRLPVQPLNHHEQF
jgi:hypothetical protein